MTVLSACKGVNADLFPSILSIYAPPMCNILDATYGKGAFWANVDRSQWQVKTNDLFSGFGETQYDFRNMPYEDAFFDMVILDPPYAYSPANTFKSSVADCYALNTSVDISNMKKVKQLYADGITEARRLLKKDAYLVVKTQDIIESGKQWWMHCWVMQQEGFTCKDLFVLVQHQTPTMDPKWGKQQHARKNHSFFVVLKKLGN